MAETANKVPNHGDHDRVQMLSLRPDGTPDQHDPEIIGDKDVAVSAAKEQFAQQAVSAADVGRTRTGPVTLVGQDDGSVKAVEATTGDDPSIKAVKDEHDKVAKQAESAAEKAVNSLTRA